MTFPVHVAVDRLEAAASRRIEGIVGSAVPAVAPALALCAWQAGQCRFDIHAGWLDPEAANGPVHDDASFDLASLTKLFTATAFLGFVEVGGVGLDDKVSGLIPELAAGGPRPVDGGEEPLSRRPLPTPADREGWTVDPSEVTFRQLLTHTSGMAPWRSIFRMAGPVPPPPAEPDPVRTEERWSAGLAAVYGSPFVDRPGREHHYSDLGFMALGDAIRRLAGQPLDEVVRERVSGALGLRSADYRPIASGDPSAPIVPTSMDADWRGRRCRGEVEDENAAGLGGVAGHAGIFATARDVAAFGQAWLSADPRLGIGRALIAQAITGQTRGLSAARGLCWQVQPTDHLAPFGPRAFGHTGFTGTSLAIDPDRELIVVLLTNRVYAGREHAGIDELRRTLHGMAAEALS